MELDTSMANRVKEYKKQSTEMLDILRQDCLDATRQYYNLDDRDMREQFFVKIHDLFVTLTTTALNHARFFGKFALSAMPGDDEKQVFAGFE